MPRTFGKYRLVERIASGGMAEVWRAEAPGPQGFVKEVALKLVRGDHRERDDFVRMFVQEARLASRLSHANIVQVFDFDQVDGRYYIAMELVRGHTLREVVDRCRESGLRFGLARAVHVCAEVARALDHAHRLEATGAPAGVVHRDVSPQNVLLSFEGDVKLADFGIARALGSEETSPGTVKGKLAYMSPEQARGEPVDARADVFALGAILWELCTGRRLFARESEAATLTALLSPEPVSPPSAWNEDVPPELDALVLAALERDPARRTASAEPLARGLASLRLRLATDHDALDVRALLLRLWPDGAAASPASAAPTRATQVRADPFQATTLALTAERPRWRRVGLVAAGALLVTAAGGVALWRPWRGAPRHAAGAAALASAPAPAPAPAPPATPPPRVQPAAMASAAPPPPASPPMAASPTASSPAAPESPRAEGAGRPEPARPAPADGGSESPRRSTEGHIAPPAVEASEPSAAKAPGVLAVRANPWARITVDERPMGETPLDLELPAGAHRVSALHPTLGHAEAVVRVRPGARAVWKPRLAP